MLTKLLQQMGKFHNKDKHFLQNMHVNVLFFLVGGGGERGEGANGDDD